MVVTRGSDEEISASVEFLKWFTDQEHNLAFSIASGYLPVTKEATDMKQIEKKRTGTERYNKADSDRCGYYRQHQPALYNTGFFRCKRCQIRTGIFLK